MKVISSRFLGQIHRMIRLFDQLLGIAAIMRKEADANTDRNSKLVIIYIEC